jgi:O-antigen/teichoic acid export membrane protein
VTGNGRHYDAEPVTARPESIDDVRPTPPSASGGERLARLLGVRDVGRALRDFATYLPTQAVPAIAGFLVLPILARKLAPNELGILAIAQTLVTLGWTLGGSWLTLAIIRELPAYRAARDLGGFARTLLRALSITAAGLLVFTALLVVASLVSNAIAQNLWLIVAGAVGLCLQNIAVTLFAADLRPRAYALTEVAARVGGISIGVALVFDGRGVHGYLTGIAASSLAVGTVGLILAWPRGPRSTGHHDETLNGWIHYGIPASTSAIGLWALFFVDRYLLAALKNENAVGVYAVGATIGDKAVTIPTLAFFTGAGPLLVTAYEHGGRASVERLMRSYSRLMVLISVPIVAYLAGNAGILVPLFAGRRYYYPAVPVITIVAVGSFIYSLALIGNTGLIVAKRTIPLVSAAFIGLFTNVVANLILIPPFGIKGAAIATPIGMAAYLVSVQIWARRHVTWHFPFSTLVRATLAAGVGYVTMIELERLSSSGPMELFLGGAGGGALYMFSLWVFREHRSHRAA